MQSLTQLQKEGKCIREEHYALAIMGICAGCQPTNSCLPNCPSSFGQLPPSLQKYQELMC